MRTFDIKSSLGNHNRHISKMITNEKKIVLVDNRLKEINK